MAINAKLSTNDYLEIKNDSLPVKLLSLAFK